MRISANDIPMRRNRRRGFALMLVLVLLAMTAVVGVSYVSSAAMRTAAVNNCVRASRARYIAESGLNHALYLMKYDANDVVNATSGDPLGPYFVDGTNDSYVIYAENATDADGAEIPGRYLLYARATAGEVQQTSTATIQRSSEGEVAFRTGCGVNDGAAWLPACLRLEGPVVVNGGLLLNSAHIEGDVSATGSIIPWGGSIEGDVTPRAPAQEMPTVAAENYRTYTCGGGIYNARSLEVETYDSTRDENEGGVVTVGNPGGVLELKPPGGVVRMTGGVEFEGTIVIEGDLLLDGEDIELIARPGFPAIVCTGRVWLTGRTKAQIDGLVVARYGVWSYFTDNSTKLRINGGLSSEQVGFHPFLNGDLRVEYAEEQCRLVDVSGRAETISLDLLQWGN